MAKTYKTFVDGFDLPAADVNSYLMKQANIQAQSTDRPSSPQEGMRIVQTDTDEELVFDGTSWVTMSGYGAWKTYTPVATNFTVGNGSAAGRYQRMGKACAFSISITFGSTSTWANGFEVSLPFTSVSGQEQVVSGMAYDSSLGVYYGLNPLIGAGFGTVLLFISPGGFTTSTTPFTWASGDSINLSGTYEIA